MSIKWESARRITDHPVGKSHRDTFGCWFTVHGYTKECQVSTPKRNVLLKEREPTGHFFSTSVVIGGVVSANKIPPQNQMGGRMLLAHQKGILQNTNLYSILQRKHGTLKYFSLASRSLDFHLSLPGRLRFTTSLQKTGSKIISSDTSWCPLLPSFLPDHFYASPGEHSRILIKNMSF